MPLKVNTWSKKDFQLKKSTISIMLAILLTILVACNNIEETISPVTSNHPKLVSSEDAPVIINQNSDGQTVHVNMVKFTGKVSNFTNITINNVPPIMNSDGTYYKILDLTPGKNIIDLRTIEGNNVKTKKITIYFSPPIVIYLEHPQFDNSGDTDYSKTPLNIFGKVSNPEAKVTVAGRIVSVESDGTFSTQVVLQPNQLISATATLGEETDTDTLNLILVQENGKIGIAPGAGIGGNSRLIGDSTFTLKPGGTIDSLYTLEVRRNDTNPDGDTCKFEIISDSLISPAPEINFNVVAFRIYANINYHIPFFIHASNNVTRGDYKFSIIAQSGSASSSSPIIVTIEPP